MAQSVPPASPGLAASPVPLMALQWPLGPAMDATLEAVQDSAGRVGSAGQRRACGTSQAWVWSSASLVTWWFRASHMTSVSLWSCVHPWPLRMESEVS